MKKTNLLLLFLFFGLISSAQKNPNPLIGKKEIETSLFYFRNDRFNSFYPDVIGLKAVYRLSSKKFTKFGIGLLLDDDLIGFSTNGSYERSIYCAVLANAILCIGKRQKWTIGADFGHGISSKKSEGQNATSKGFSHTNSGFYYSASIGYRAIISKNILLNISPFLVHKNFRHRQVTEYFSPSSIQRYEWIEQRQALGLAMGLVF